MIRDDVKPVPGAGQQLGAGTWDLVFLEQSWPQFLVYQYMHVGHVCLLRRQDLSWEYTFWDMTTEKLWR